MSRNLRIQPEAMQDLREAMDWYDEQAMGRGLLFFNAVDEKLHFLKHRPEIFAIQHRNGRLAKVDRYPYIIVFTADVSQVEVLAITHTARSPELWQSRIP